jgi:hypothetical protein
VGMVGMVGMKFGFGEWRPEKCRESLEEIMSAGEGIGRTVECGFKLWL